MRLLLFWLGLLLALPAYGEEQHLVPVRRPIAPFLQPDPREGYLRRPNRDERGTEQGPPIVKVVPPEPSPQPEEREKEKEKHERRLADYTEALFYATLFLGFATAGLAVVAYLQMRDARESVAANVQLAQAAIAHAGYAERAIIDNREAAEKQLRAYLQVHTVRMDEMNSGYSPNIFMRLRNYGQTPARCITHTFKCVPLVRPREDAFDLSGEQTEELGDLGPGQITTPTILFPHDKWENIKSRLVEERRYFRFYCFGLD